MIKRRSLILYKTAFADFSDTLVSKTENAALQNCKKEIINADFWG